LRHARNSARGREGVNRSSPPLAQRGRGKRGKKTTKDTKDTKDAKDAKDTKIAKGDPS
jgi:hypothetical protein